MEPVQAGRKGSRELNSVPPTPYMLLFSCQLSQRLQSLTKQREKKKRTLCTCENVTALIIFVGGCVLHK